MSHAVTVPDELYRAIEDYATRRGESAEAVILAWAESLKQRSDATTESPPSEVSSRVNNPTYDPWAGFRGIAEGRSADSIDRHDTYLAQEYTFPHAADR